jgi:CBS domain-containing protein
MICGLAKGKERRRAAGDSFGGVPTSRLVRPIVARDLMTPDVLSVAPEWSLTEAAAFLLDNDITGAVVRDATGELQGVVTATDLLAALVESRSGAPDEAAEARPTATVADVMTPEVYSVPSEAPVAEVAKSLLDGGLHRIFVSDGGELVGTISVSDLVGLLMEEA